MKNIQIKGHNFIKIKNPERNSTRNYYKCKNCDMEIFNSVLTIPKWVINKPNEKIGFVEDDGMNCNEYLIKNIIE